MFRGGGDDVTIESSADGQIYLRRPRAIVTIRFRIGDAGSELDQIFEQHVSLIIEFCAGIASNCGKHVHHYILLAARSTIRSLKLFEGDFIEVRWRQ